MKQTLYSIYFIVLTLMVGCIGKPLTIPEVSSNIEKTPVYSMKHTEKLLKTIAYKGNLFMIFRDGEIVRIDAVTFIKNARYKCIFDFAPEIKVFNNFVQLSNSLKNKKYLFDLNKMCIAYSWDSRKFNNIKCCDEKIMVYKSGNKVIAFDYKNKIKLGYIPVKEPILNCFIDKGKVIVCTENKVSIYNYRENSRRVFTLKDSTKSGFLLENDLLYYFSKQRYLIKYSLIRGKRLWRFKLPTSSSSTPYRINGYIIVVLKNNNIYFFNKNGSLLWWNKFGASPFLPPLTMSENIAIALRPKKTPSIKFFDVKKKKFFLYNINTPFLDYFYNERGIHIITEFKEELTNKYDIFKIDNVYGVDIKILSQEALVKNKSIEFMLTPVNLIKPVYNITVLNSKKKIIYSKKIDSEKSSSFVWLPKSNGVFELNIVTASKNKDKVLSKLAFNVIDIETMQYNYYYKILSNCTEHK